MQRHFMQMPECPFSRVAGHIITCAMHYALNSFSYTIFHLMNRGLYIHICTTMFLSLEMHLRNGQVISENEYIARTK